ncbi:MAG TPA: FCD domain-containing protein [Spirochaetia bacterium]|nr:FCD domain-containing protein [Spirochaetia bacterium]
MSVREGLQRLERLGLLETRHRAGTFVRGNNAEDSMSALLPILALSSTDIFDVLEFRRIIEEGTVTLVAEKGTSEDIATLKSNYASMVEWQSDINRFTQADLQFHLILAQASGYPIIMKITRIIRDTLSVSMENIVRTFGTHDGLSYHRKLIKAIEARAVKLAESILEEHVSRTIQRLRAEEGLNRAGRDS